ncbi:Putative protein of unknown function [Podospora comata]|uniref:Pathogen-related protein n=1 Tax=Podospora comata TaxID=48703 RepID=A0ABY6SK14_PODCO|nr:Putative protein of unknown function [Podospora comata]
MSSTSTPPPTLPDYVLNPDAVLSDPSTTWRHGQPPDYTKTRQFYLQTKKSTHPATSLPALVENLVKNWEIEASYKPLLPEWRTIASPQSYTFRVNGSPPQTAAQMLSVGTYNALIEPNEFYCPAHSSFEASHKTFKRVMPSFAWEVLEVYAGPPRVVFRWRHWGVMKGDYVGTNDKGEKVTIKAHGGNIDIEGVAVADVNDKLQLGSVEVFFDPMAMFRQMAPDGETGVTKEAGTTE